MEQVFSYIISLGASVMMPIIFTVIGLYFVTDMVPDFTLAANQVYAATGDNAAHIPDGFSGGALDFASSLFGWVLYRGVKLSYVGMGVLAVITLAMMVIYRQRIVKEEKSKKVKIKQDSNEEININISSNGINSKSGFWSVWKMWL